MSDLLEPEVYQHRMIEKMAFVDELMKQSFKELADEVVEFEQNAKRRFSISNLKFINNKEDPQ